jgi:hypothetical protein
VLITATVGTGSGAVSDGAVEFTVNGLGAGRVRVNAEGVASTRFTPTMPGSYEVRARFAGTARHAVSMSRAVVLEVSR